jgi:hypothetical protein
MILPEMRKEDRTSMTVAVKVAMEVLKDHILLKAHALTEIAVLVVCFCYRLPLGHAGATERENESYFEEACFIRELDQGFSLARELMAFPNKA